ncbi:MAG: cytochrome c biogenesis CcdA family protein [Patescibacteria group bacterium]
MDLLIGTSLLAAFIAGIAALLAPCCITVLLPSYFGSVFRTRRKVFLMTFIFFLGILTVFIPLGLGFSALGQFFSRYHQTIFGLAGLFFLGLGATLLLGKKFAMPFSIHPTLAANNAGSVYVLGILSGVATTCCAPVLAGALALSVLPGSILWGVVYTLAYVLGMVAPLFLLAGMMDKSRLTERLMGATKPVVFRLGTKTFEVALSDLISGITFLVVGLLTLGWAFMNKTATHSSLQVDINITLTQLQRFLSRIIGGVPEFVWALVFVGVFGVIAWIARIQFRQDKETNQKNCHEK